MKMQARGLGAVAALVVGLAAGTGEAAPGEHLWSHTFGNGTRQTVRAFAVEGAGGSVVVGDYLGSVDFGAGALPSAGYYDRAFVVRFDASGKAVWSRSFGGVNEDDMGMYLPGRAVAFDAAGNLVLAGNFAGTLDLGCGPMTGYGDLFVAKLDAAGRCLTSRSFDGHLFVEEPQVAVDGAGNVVVAGRFNGSVDLGGGTLSSSGQYDLFVVKFDGALRHVWSRAFVEGSGQMSVDVAVDGSGNVVLAGAFGEDVNFGGAWLTSSGQRDIFVAKLSGSGQHLWSKRFGDAGDQFATSVSTDGAGNVVLTGGFGGRVGFGGATLASVGPTDIFLAKLTGTGSHLWSQRFGDELGQKGLQVATDAAGNIVTTGSYVGYVDFGAGPLENEGDYKVYVAKFDAAGAFLWSQAFVNEGESFGANLGLDGRGDVLLSGGYAGYGWFGGELFLSQGLDDVYLAKLGR
ncbi:hypothetical protein JQX13_43315 [Archangium violaceum]|uniref:hypothetical protein n=1 Tax=Archangium violaceum TaxID=83451 RepID=UPI00193B13E4|nr:hypothetical protein [Archangium violaceum]QRK06824.1 hypothetical protein JQX13_43315 [Archangium violaceum]